MEKWLSEISEDVTYFQIWLKYYVFLSKYYPEFFSKVLTKYHYNFFTGLICEKTKLSLEFQTVDCKNVKDNLQLSCMYFNARSLLNKMPLLSGYVCDDYPDLIAITETWAIAETPDGFYSLPGYNLFRADRTKKRGGGVIIFIRDTITSSELSFSRYDEFEALCIKIPLKNGLCAGVLCVYRPPNITAAGDLRISNLIEKFMQLDYTYNVIVGDFNMPEINWKSLSATHKYSPFVRCISDHFLKQHITEPTRPQSNAILDLVFTTIDTNIQDISITECFGSSDHSIIRFCLQFQFIDTLTRPAQPPKRDYNKAKWNVFNDFIQNYDWESVFTHEDVDTTWLKFKAALSSALDVSVPHRKRKSWAIKSSPKIRTALRYMRRCNQQFKILKNNEALLKLVHAKENLQNLINQQVEFFEKHLINSSRVNPKAYWSYVNGKLKKDTNMLNSIKLGDRTVEDPLQIAEIFNDYFYDNLNHNMPYGDLSVIVGDTDGSASVLDNININFKVVLEVIKQLPNKYSEDREGFSYVVLKNGGDVLIQQLTRLFKLSFELGKLPQDWKCSMIFPIKKKSSSKTVEDFRPISITSCLCRTFERIIRSSIINFLSRNTLIYDSQHGFLQHKSTTSALLSYANTLSIALDSGSCVDCAYFDFSKAFDRVRHDYLIYKLKKNGISGSLIKWIIDYLSNRTQAVKVKGHISSERRVTSGVIQGSVLGPLLFIIFVNDVDDVVTNCSLLKYADDIRIYRCFKSDNKSQLENSKLFQKDIGALSAWSTKWDLKFNISKCCVLHFGRANNLAEYKMNNCSIPKKEKERDLGILFSTKFKFDEHMLLIAKKANKQLGIITKVFSKRRPETIISLYKTFVRPHLEYNSSIWSPHTIKNEKIIEKVQKRMCNIIYGKRSSASYQEKLKQAGLLSLKARRLKHDLILVYKMKNNLMDVNFEDFFHENPYKKTRGNIFKLLVPKSKSKIRQNFFTSSIIKHWNLLKSSDINVRRINIFKKNVLRYLAKQKIW